MDTIEKKKIRSWAYEFKGKFQLNYPNPIIFLEAFNELYNLSKKTLYLSQYILELSLLDPKYCKYNPSLLASSAIYLSLKY